jgi:hypothetical protein
MKTYIFELTDNETKVYEILGNVLTPIALRFEGKPINTWNNTVKFSFEEGNIKFVPHEVPYQLLNQNVFLDKIYFLGFDYQKDWVMAEFIKVIAKHNDFDLKSSQLIFVISHNLFIGVNEIEGLDAEEDNFCKVVPKIFKDSFQSLRIGYVHILLEGLLDISVMDILHKLNRIDTTLSVEFQYCYLDDHHFFINKYDDELQGVHQIYASTSRSLNEKYMGLINPFLMNQYEDLSQLSEKIHRNLIANYLVTVHEENFEYLFQDHRLTIPIHHHSLYIEEFLKGADKVMPEVLDYKKPIPLFFLLNTKFDSLFNHIKKLIENERIVIFSHDQLKEFEKTMLYYAYYLVNQSHPFSKKSLFLKNYPQGIKDVVGDETYVYNYLSLIPKKEGLQFLQASKLYKYYKTVLRPIRDLINK